MNYAALLVRIAVPALALCAACDRPGRSEVSGVESFCVEVIDGPEGRQLEVSAQIDACLSSSCDSVVESECTLTEVDGVLQIEASAVIESRGRTCTADCGAVSATCTAPVASDETYILRGDDGDQVEIDAGDDERTCTLEPI